MDAPEPTAAIVVAAGQGRRLGAAKPFVLLAGRPLLARALEAVLAPPEVTAGVVVAAPDQLGAARAVAAAFGKVTAVVGGGNERQDSVAAGLAALGDVAWVVVHDAARPLASAALVRRVLAAARVTGAATAALPARDTVKVVADGRVRHTLDRETIWLTQTPQAFDAALLRQAHRHAARTGLRATDDAELVAGLGTEVRVVEGEISNLKVTTPEDLMLADALLRPGGGAPRTGIGYDAHRLVDGRRLVLGGVEIPFARGLAGHSDGDAVLHAVSDALLGAAGLPDIGHHFPSTDDRYAGADSRGLLAAVVRRVAAAGFVPAQADVIVLAEAPRLAAYLPAMRGAIAALLGLAEDAVAVKATTTDGLGAIGRGEGIAAQAVVTVHAASGGGPAGLMRPGDPA